MTLAGDGLAQRQRGRYLSLDLSLNFSSGGALHGRDPSARQGVRISAGVEGTTDWSEPQAEFRLVAQSLGEAAATVCQLETLQPDGTDTQQRVLQDGRELVLATMSGMIGARPEDRQRRALRPDDIWDMAMTALKYAIA